MVRLICELDGAEDTEWPVLELEQRPVAGDYIKVVSDTKEGDCMAADYEILTVVHMIARSQLEEEETEVSATMVAKVKYIQSTTYPPGAW